VHARKMPPGDASALRERVIEWVEESAAWYDLARECPEPNGKLYAELNSLHLQPLSREAKDHAKLISSARRCATRAQTDYSAEPDFWNAVMAADAHLAWTLLDGSFGAPDDRGVAVAADVANTYQLAISGVGPTPRELDSVTRQLELLADLYSAIKGEGDQTAGRLRKIAALLRGAG